MSKSQTLRDLVIERLVVAADEIFALFERTIAEYEEEALRSKQLLEINNKGVQTLSVNLEVGPSPEQTLCIKQEPEPSLEFPLTSVSVKTEDNVAKSFLLEQEPPKENREEPGCSLYLQSDKDKQTCSCSDTDDSDDWEPSAKRTTTWDRQESETVQTLLVNKEVEPDLIKKRPAVKSKEGGLGEQLREEKPNVTNLQSNSGAHCSSDTKDSDNRKDSYKFSCSVCKRGFYCASSLKLHMKSHTTDRPFSCPQCGLKYKYRHHVFQHISAIHRKEKLYKCLICEKGFGWKNAFKSHMRMHIGMKTLLVNNEFGSVLLQKEPTVKNEEGGLGEQLREEKPGCSSDVTNLQSNSGASDAKDSDNWKDSKPFSCSICKRGFYCASSLKLHMKSHTTDRPFSCPECGLKYKYRHHVFQHINAIHRRETLYSCLVCEKVFAWKSAFKSHMRLRHAEETSFSCKVCKESFENKFALEKHLFKVHAVVQDKVKTPQGP